MNLDPFTGPGSTPSRRRFWDKVTQAVIASQKVAGKNVSVDEHQGYGSLISVNPQRQGAVAVCGPPCASGSCPDISSICLTLTDLVVCTDCINAGPFGSNARKFTDLGINRQYVLPFDPDFGYFTVVDFPLVLHQKIWTNGDCSGDPFTEEDESVVVSAGCDSMGVWWVRVFLGNLVFFAADGATDPSSIPNQFSSGDCNTDYADPLNSTFNAVCGIDGSAALLC